MRSEGQKVKVTVRSATAPGLRTDLGKKVNEHIIWIVVVF